ncbi:MAG: hypothetical protein LKI34_00305 [Bifidobacterium tibiigranuli]|uniref:hypothetical protein n=1 Tax=Bifidobacterium tibiigranuli TaxID=2172043 RepID=UPI0026E943C3|nr:hypothetical protein [Bifidobacterium tibiigranuli]MCI1672653.1 hypothetical protein [Bifidobacterium tibiigranuli]MCI1712342.1 hypothetical protein [Bifidobacterium tibiigranuli]MCI1833340.1 hypothetical protein [Bifidobacterium tibiigranuli]
MSENSDETKHENDLLPLGAWFKAERDGRISHGAYYWTSIVLAYNSNHIEGSTLTQRQTQQIYDTDSFTPQGDGQPIKVDDIIETKNHFRAFNLILDH